MKHNNLDLFAKHIILESLKSIDWYTSSVRPARNPLISLPLARKFIQFAEECNIDTSEIYEEYLKNAYTFKEE